MHNYSVGGLIGPSWLGMTAENGLIGPSWLGMTAGNGLTHELCTVLNIKPYLNCYQKGHGPCG